MLRDSRAGSRYRCLENPRPAGAEPSLTEDVTSPFRAEPRHLPSCWSSYTTAGPLRSTGITPLHCYCWPLRHPLAVHRFPGVAGYTVFCSVGFLHGTRRASPVASCVLVIVPSLSPRQSVSPPQSVFSDPCCLHSQTVSSAPGFKVFEVTCAFTFVTAR
jgi:hypothetical protein